MSQIFSPRWNITGVQFKLGLMMFLDFFVWGTWYVTMGTFLVDAFNADGIQVAIAYEAQAIGAIVAPVIVGILADRYFSAQKLMGVIHLIGAVLLYQASVSHSFNQFYPYILSYLILYMPTMALCNAISFRQMKNPTKEFTPIRVLGTIGWIAAGLFIAWFNWEAEKTLEKTFLLGAIVSVILGVFSFTLPKTPPLVDRTKKVSILKLLGLDSFRILKSKSYLLFFISSILICIPLSFYYAWANPFLNDYGMAGAAGVMTLGQVSEVFFMLLLPFFLLRFGIKNTLIIGIVAWFLRYLLFAYGGVTEQTWMLIVGIVLHGICYDFFFVSGQIYTELKAPKEYKSSAQGLIALATYGVGMFLGFRFAGIVYERYQDGGVTDWFGFWLIPAIFALGVLIIFVLLFRETKKYSTQSESN
ncbi:MAG: MFS transporter [Flavobacteriaceae bacterium]|nr:MFS transporter [Flavobacteriaceae bacterium]